MLSNKCQCTHIELHHRDLGDWSGRCLEDNCECARFRLPTLRDYAANVLMYGNR